MFPRPLTSVVSARAVWPDGPWESLQSSLSGGGAAQATGLSIAGHCPSAAPAQCAVLCTWASAPSALSPKTRR